MPVKPSRAPLAAGSNRSHTALLIIDMISTWDFPGADRLLGAASKIAPAIARLRLRCHAAGVPVVYVNDNQGHWRSEFHQVVESALAGGRRGAEIASRLKPDSSDYAVLKPKHSAFFATPLDLLLRHLRVVQIVVTGVAAEHCILLSAAEAHMRDYRVIAPADCIAAQTESRKRLVLRQLPNFEVRTTASRRVRLTSGPRSGTAGKPTSKGRR